MFFSNKNLAIGEGGMVTTARDDLAESVRRLRSHGMTTLTWDRHRGHASFFRMVEPGSIDALADAMVELVAQDPAARAERCARARRRVREEHDEQTTTRRLVGIYQTLLAAPRLSPGAARTAEAGLPSGSR